MRYFSFIFFLFSFAGFYAQSRTINKVKEDFAAAKFAEGLARLNSLSKDPDEQTLFFYYKAVYFSASTNPSYQLDSAYACVARSEELFLTSSEKVRTQFCTDYQICMPRFAQLKDSLCNEIYGDLVRKKDLAGLQKFVRAYPNAKALSLAQQKIEDLQFERASAANDLLLLDDFLKLYPQSKYKPQINAQREKLRYDQALKVNALASYQQFLADFPNAANKQDILNRLEVLVYNNAKAANSVSIYQDFLAQFPTSKYKSELEGFIYQLRFEAVSEQKDMAAIEKLLLDFPKGPKNNELLVILDDLYYNKAQAEPTIENLEVYCKKYKNNTVRYSELFQKLEKLHYDKAIIAASKDVWLAFIEQFPNSKYLPQAKIALAELFTILPYLNANGRMEFRDLQTQTQQFNKTFDYVSPFEDGRAIVQDNGRFGLIDEQGKYLITPLYDQIETAFQSKLIIASKLKTGLAVYWQKNTDEIYNDEWSADEIAALKNYLSTQTTYQADDQLSLQAYRRYLGALISRNYYSYSDFNYYAEDSEKFRNIREKAQEEFNLMEYTLYLFAKGPFTTKNVESCEVYGSYGDQFDAGHLEYTLNDEIYYLEYKNGAFVERGSEEQFIVSERDGVFICRKGYFENEEAYNPGEFYLKNKDGVRLTNQEFNSIMPITDNSAYYLCHQGGSYEQVEGISWGIVGGKWGVINKNGQIILPLIFDELSAVDSFNLNPYFISTINKVYPTEYNDYKETLGNVGLIDLQGKELIPYSDGYNMIDYVNSETIIVTKGAVLGFDVQGMYRNALPFGGLTGVVNLQRKTILPLEYYQISALNGGRQFVVRKGTKLIASKEYPDNYAESGGKYSLVNRSNQFLIPTPLDFLGNDLVGCLGCSVTSIFGEAYNGKWGVINESGKTVVPFTYSDARSTQIEGVFIVNTGQNYKKTEYGFEEVASGKFGLLRNGTLMTAMKYDDIYVHDDYIVAELGKQKDFFQPNCQPLPFNCDDISEIGGQTEGNTALLAYRIGAKWGLMNTKFEKITEANFWGEITGETNHHPFTYDKGLYLVDQGGLKFYVTRKGVVLKDGL